MRVPEISLGNGLQAQNKNDLCRCYKYTERRKQTQYLQVCIVSFMVVPIVRHGGLGRKFYRAYRAENLAMSVSVLQSR